MEATRALLSRPQPLAVEQTAITARSAQPPDPASIHLVDNFEFTAPLSPGEKNRFQILAQLDITGIDRAIAAAEKVPDQWFRLSESTMRSIGLGAGVDLIPNPSGPLNAGVKFRLGIGAAARGQRVSGRMLALALRAAKDHLLAAQGHYDQTELYNTVARKLNQMALDLPPGAEQDKLLDRAERYFLRAEAEMKVGDVEVGAAQAAFLKGIAVADPPQPILPQQRRPVPPTLTEAQRRSMRLLLAGASLSLALLLLL